MSDWRTRAKPLNTKLPTSGNGGYVDDIGLKDLNLQDIQQAIGEPVTSTDWRSRAKPIQNTQKPASEVNQNPAQKQVGIGRTAFDQALQGATFGFADEIADAGAAAAVAPFVDESFKDLYTQARQSSKEQLAAEFKQNPGTSIAANLAGGILTGGAGATTRAGQAAGNLIRSGNLAARVGKGAVAGAASGALYGAGSADDGSRLEGAERGGLYGGVAGAVIPAVGAAASRLNTKTVVPTSAQVFDKSRSLYKEAADIGASYKADATDDLINFAQKELVPTDEFARSVLGDDSVTQMVSRIAQNSGKKMTLDTFDQLDKSLGSLAHEAIVRGDKDISRRYTMLQGKLRDIVENPNMIEGTDAGIKAYREATKKWAVASKMRDIERVLDMSSTYQVPATAIKTGMRRLVTAGQRTNWRGYTNAERKAIEYAAKTGRLEGILQTFGSRLVSIAGGAAGGVKGAMLGHFVSEAGRAGAEAVKTNQADKITRMIAERSGMVQQTPRIDLRQIMKLPPAKAAELLKRGK